jgi:PBP1b-binding outer membrane lipoprotein LpoB
MKGKLILTMLAVGLLFVSCAKEDPVTTGASKKAPAQNTNTTP